MRDPPSFHYTIEYESFNDTIYYDLGKFSALNEDLCRATWTTSIFDKSRGKYLTETYEPAADFPANNTLKIY